MTCQAQDEARRKRETEDSGKKECATCEERKARDGFSHRQWCTEVGRRCEACTGEAVARAAEEEESRQCNTCQEHKLEANYTPGEWNDGPRRRCKACCRAEE